MNYIDFHTHLDWYKDQNTLLQQLAAFEGTIIAASVDESSFKQNCLLQTQVAALTNKVKIISTMGTHPQNAGQISNLRGLSPLLDASPLIGEIGMDFCWVKNVSPLQQEKVFRFYLEHCQEKEKYCVIHTKDAEAQIARILEEYPKAKPIIHWYDGPEDIYQEFCHRGYYETFGCETSRSKHIQKLLKQTPVQLILAETDNPTGEPWLGGSDDSVFLIKRIYSDIGNVLGMSDSEVGEIIKENAEGILENLPAFSF